MDELDVAWQNRLGLIDDFWVYVDSDELVLVSVPFQVGGEESGIATGGFKYFAGSSWWRYQFHDELNKRLRCWHIPKRPFDGFVLLFHGLYYTPDLDFDGV